MTSGRVRGAMTGLRCFDRRLGGLKPGWLVVIGGRPSMGKTALGRVAAYGCAERNPTQTVAFFAIEMEKREIVERALSAATHVQGDGIPYQDLGNAKVAPMDLMRLRELKHGMPANLVIDDRSVLSLEDVRRRVFALKRKRGVAAVFIDYLQLMAMPPAQGRNDAARWGEVTSGLKRLAREAQTCIVLLSQLSRAVESRDDKRPQLSDLRDSGSIEQDANAVLFPFREFYYVERNEPKPGTDQHTNWEMECEALRRRLDVIAAKVRQGAVGTDQQAYYAEYDHIEDWRGS
jgi:replicative DNA helicase